MYKGKIIDVDNICKEYLNGVNTVNLGIKYNVSPSTINSRIKKSNNKLAIEKLKGRSYVSPGIIINDYIKKDIKVEDLAKQYYKDIKHIKKILELSRNEQVYIKLFNIDNRQGEDKEYHLKLIDYLIHYTTNDDIVVNIEKTRILHGII